MKFYLFTDIDKLLNQNSNNEFGAITSINSDSEKFQITSIHNCQSDSKAYAITDGFIMIQPNQNDQTLVNILLKPKRQCIENIPIEYFIYRGVKKSSIFNNSQINSTGNDLCDLISNTIAKLDQKYPVINHTPEEYILAYGSVADTDFTSNVFPVGTLPENIRVDSIINTSNLKYKPFEINGGAYIGNLNAEFGVDVVLEKARIKISEVRKSNNFIISHNLTGLSGEDFIDNKTEKEKILNYFDICQFYTLTYEKIGIWAKNSSENTFAKIRNSNQINDVLNKFNNKDVLFIDIRNEYNNSLNYQDNIAGTIGVKKDSNNYNYFNFPDWPILKVNIGAVSNIQIKIPKSDFVNVRAYFRENNKNSYSFKAINFDSSNYSTSLKITLTKTPSGITLPSYFYFMFLKEIDENTYPTEWVIKPTYFIDTLFDIEDLIYTDVNESIFIYGLSYYEKITKWKIHEENKYVDLRENAYIAKLGVAEDQNNIYFFAFSNGNSLQTSAVDIPIVTGDSDKENFLTDILFPKLNNTLSIYSYKINQGGQNVYVLNDNINNIKPNNALKLIQNKNSFTLIAIDKQENLVKLKNAYLQFANNLPKRLTIKNRQEVVESGTDTHWEADIFIVGYGNDTVTNSFKIKEVNTNIKLIYSNKEQKIVGTNKFNENFVKTVLEINSENFYGKMFKHIRYNFRNLPDYVNGSTVKFQGGRRDIYFKVVGKCESPSNITWYFVELLEDEPDFDDPENKKGEKGHRYFISKGASPVIIAKFNSFLKELSYQNTAFDNSTNASQNDTLKQRITRYRQRGHNSDVDLFNDVIGTSVTDPIYLDQIPYESDQSISIPAETGTDPASVGFNITNRLQLYRDFEVIEFSNGKTAEIQHLFVGLDVIGNLMEDFDVYYYLFVIHIINNVHFSLHSGDAGTVPNPVYDFIIDDPNNSGLEAIRNAIVTLFEQDTLNNKKLNPLNNRFYQHFLNTRFALHDRYGNLYSFGLYYQLFKTVWVYEPPNPSASFQLEALFSSFNIDMNTSESDSVRYFYEFFSGNLTQLISATANVSLYNDLRENTFAFSKIWRKLEEGGPEIIEPEEAAYLEYYSNIAIQEYINLINVLRNKFF